MGARRLLYLATADRFWGFLEGQARYVRSRGFEIHAASSPGAGLEGFAAGEGAVAWPLPMARGIALLADVASLARLVRLIRRLRPEVVHAHTPKAGLLGMMAAALCRVPVRVYTLHGLAWRTRRGWRRRLLAALDRLACRLATCVLAVSRSVQQAALAEGLGRRQGISVPGPGGSANGLDFGRFDPARVSPAAAGGVRKRCGIPAEAVVAGYVGRLVPDKGIAGLAAAWAILRERFPGLHLLVAGETEAHDPLPQGLLERLLGDPRVHWSGWAGNMPEHYLAMDFCLIPSRREGLPYAVIEAAAMERPAVGFRVEGVVDAIEHGRTGLLAETESPAALVRAAAALVEDPGLRRRLGRAARRRAIALYQQRPVWEAVAAAYSVQEAPERRLWWKRPLDAAAAAVLLAACWPLLAALAVAVWIDLGRPILFRQSRPGLGERRFELLKFRTMRGGTGPDGERLTRLGRWLRRSSLDELPQLINILRGEMSFIGPRPLLERYLPFYTERERLRHRVRPGLTGWAQVHGRNDLGWRERLELDAWYAEHASFRLDARIAWRTVWCWLTARGVQDDPSAALADLDQERSRA